MLVFGIPISGFLDVFRKGYYFLVVFGTPRDYKDKVCSSKGVCWDDAAGRRQAEEEGVPRAALPVSHGNGSCSCFSPFHGESCEQGSCPAGSSLSLNATSQLYQCNTCQPGYYKSSASDHDPCTPCSRGTYSANPGQTICDACPAGEVSEHLGQSMCTKCPPGYEPSAGQVTCQPLTCRGTKFRFQNQCVTMVPFIVGVAAILCAIVAAFAYRMLQKRIVSQAAFMKANHQWQQLHSLADRNCVAKQIAGRQINSMIEDARHESTQFGISLDYVLNELEETAKTAMSHHEWRHDGQFVMALAGFLLASKVYFLIVQGLYLLLGIIVFFLKGP